MSVLVTQNFTEFHCHLHCRLEDEAKMSREGRKGKGVFHFIFALICDFMSVYSIAGTTEQIKPLQGLLSFLTD